MKTRFYTMICAAIAALSLSGCNLDINKDPYDVTKLDIPQLLTCTEYEVGATFSEGNYLNANFSSYVHHTVSREVANYSLSASYSTLGNTWSQAYRFAIKNCDALIENGDAEGNAIYASIGRILRAHVYMNLVDLWGDIPYSEANVPGIETPKCDASEDIYNDLLKSLNKAIADLKDATAKNNIKPAADDLFYAGDDAKWLKAANTLKLKLLVQSRLAKAKITDWATELSALIAEDNFLADGEDLQFPHSKNITPADERNSGYVDEYQGGQKSVWISPWFYECLNGKSYNWTDNPFKTIVDPRITYYYYKQAKATTSNENETDYRDGAFISIMFGSNSTYSSMSQENYMTIVGIYPVGGIYDDGAGTKITSASGHGICPDKMLQAYSVPFMKAELALAGEITGDARALLQAGIEASLVHVQAVSKASDPACPSIAAADATSFINAILGKYDAADADHKMEIVMTQKWIANFYNPVEAYSDIRRTGYPKLFKGDDSNKAWTPYAQVKDPTPTLTSYDLVNILAYPRIMYYPQSEITVNPNVTNEGRIVSNSNVFWDVK